MRFIARLLSYLFHPLLIPTIMLSFMLALNPYAFSAHQADEKGVRLILIIFFITTFVIPISAIVMMRLLGFIKNIEQVEREERIGPFLVILILYIWVFLSFRHSLNIPHMLSAFMLGTTISVAIAFFINLFSKISLHTLGMGGLVTGMVLTMMSSTSDTGMVWLPVVGHLHFSALVLLLVVIVIAGAVGTARLLLGAHTPGEVFGGYLVGCFGQLVSLPYLLG